LDKAVEQEDFEQAAQMRDEIKATKEKLAGLAAS
jgi:protein-arginine kinase activator protein McsA